MPYMMDVKALHIFQRLLAGTWSNAGIMKKENGKEVPYSYNIMPLPQHDPEPLYNNGNDHHGYILKNFRYTESISFHAGKDHPNGKDHKHGCDTVAAPGGAPNRGETQRQVPQALFYDQVVKFAEGPKDENVVHLENGAWLHLAYHQVINGPYHSEGAPQTPPLGTPNFAKQISVPHGNSVLALGMYTGYYEGHPAIPQGTGLPTMIDTARYDKRLDKFSKPPSDDRLKNDYENPHEKLNADPLKPLRDAIAKLDPKRYHHVWFSTRFSSLGLTGVVTNIPFEARMAAATDYEAQYWLLSTEEEGDEKYSYLAYFQNITLRLTIGGKEVVFPHVTANVVKRQTKPY